MKNLPIRFKITLWFAAALVIVVLLTYTVILYVSNQVLQKTIRDNLIETVANNIDEVEYVKSIEKVPLDDVDHFITYGNAFLEVDDDFLDEVNEIYTALYDGSLYMLYGENPIANDTSQLLLLDSVIQTVKCDNVTYYVFDRVLTQEGLEGLWLRGIAAETQGKEETSTIFRLSIIILPLFVMLAVIGGYLIARRALSPIQKISDTASKIGKGGDLKNRIEIGEGKDELHQLVDNFNEMFGRLDNAFEKERQFTSDASHELRTPMCVIMAQCEYSLEKERNIEEYEKALTVIQRQGKKMTGLINDMLAFTRLDMGADGLTREKFDLTKLVNSVCMDMSFIKQNGISLEYTAAENVAYVGNYNLISTALTNLISNAYRYGNENGHIWVKLIDCENEIRLSVKDDGIGIAEEDMQKVFQRFYQVDKSRTSCGTGLGLSMVQKITEFHGGTVLLDSEKEKGSTFTIVLPKCM